MIIFCKQRGDDVKYFAEDGRIENVYGEIKLDCKLQFQAQKDNGIKLQSKCGGNCVFVKTTFIYSTVSHSIMCAINFEFKTDKKSDSYSFQTEHTFILCLDFLV